MEGRALRRAARHLGTLVACCLLVVWLGGGSCSVAYSSCTNTDPNHTCKKHPPRATTSPIVEDEPPQVRGSAVLFDVERGTVLQRFEVVADPER